MKEQPTIYIAGAITNDPLYQWKFHEKARELKERGYIVANPAVLPPEFPYESLMHMSRAMMEECETVYMLKDWKTSEGAQREYGYSVAMGKEIILEDEEHSPPYSKGCRIGEAMRNAASSMTDLFKGIGDGIAGNGNRAKESEADHAL